MKETLMRTLMIVVFLPILAFTLYSEAHNSLYFAVLISIVGIGGVSELSAMLKGKGYRIFPYFLMPSVILAYYFFFKNQQQYLVLIFIGLIFIATLLQLMKQDFEKAMNNMGLTVLGFLVLGIMLGTLIPLKQINAKHLILLIAGTWFCDIGAYVVGKLIGRTRLNLKASPNKTLEGIIGGIVIALVALGLSAYWTGIPFQWWMALLPVITILGDLFESVLKRGCEVKDSSKIVPGHGGILDVFDSLMFTAPYYYYCLVIFN
jgi:phosphatidate cytidylyltransferase